MRHWTNLSIEYANQRNYLDDLFRVYPTIPEGIRDIDKNAWKSVERSFENKNDAELIRNLLALDLFPIKDSYVAYMKRDQSAINRNPLTISRLCGRLYEMGLNKIFEKCSEPKETNRQIGPMFRNWIKSGALNLTIMNSLEFSTTKDNGILDAGDAELMSFAREHLNYRHNKGLDFICRINNQYVIGEAKFLTDFGGHQNAQFNDAISIVTLEGVDAITVAVLDGVLYIQGRNKMHRDLLEFGKNYNIMSALVLREFIYQI